MNDLCEHTTEAGSRNRAVADQSDGWVIWHGRGRGYVALESGLPPLADALQALWFLRAQRREIDKTGSLPAPA
jgi:hypothetical protein